MKKNVKLVFVILIIIFASVGVGIYYLRPEVYETEIVKMQPIIETLQLKATVMTEDTYVVSATTTGIVTDIPFTVGMETKAGDEIAVIDDTEYQQELTNQILALQKEKEVSNSQGQNANLEVALRQQQLSQQADSVIQEYVLEYEDGKGAELAIESSKAIMEGAKADLNKALEENAKAENNDLPYTGNALGSLRATYEVAKINYEKALLANSMTNRMYYQTQLLEYMGQLQNLAENSDNVANTTSLAAAQLQLSIDILKRKQVVETMSAPFDGIVSQVLVEKGSYVTKNQPLIRISLPDNYQLETWMLTEDAMNYKVGDLVEAHLPDNTILKGMISFISPIAEERLSSLGVEENRCQVKIAINNLPLQMGPGYEVEVNFSKTLRDEAITIPVSTLVTKEGITGVYKMIDGKKVFTQVTTGIYSGGNAEVIDGLNAGDEIVTKVDK